MSSRKSSRRSSSRDSNKSADNNFIAESYTVDGGDKKLSNIIRSAFIALFIFSVIVQCSVLYYLYNLDDADCNCIRDWRHNFCKIYALLVLAVGVIVIGLQHLCKGFMILYYIVSLINVYAFFTYVGDLNATQCTCAVNKQYNLNTIMRIYRWLLILGGVATFMKLLTLLGVGGSKIAASS
jgi:hypothetical protein